MADELPLADRDALIMRAAEALALEYGEAHEDEAPTAVDALLPHLAVLLDRARQQGRAEVIEAITKSPPSLEELLAGTEFAAALARGSQTAPSATENAEENLLKRIALDPGSV